MAERLTPERLAEIEAHLRHGYPNDEPWQDMGELLAEVKRLQEELVLETARKGIYRHERDEARRARVALAAQVANMGREATNGR